MVFESLRLASRTRSLFFVISNKNSSLGAKSRLYGGWLINWVFWSHKYWVVEPELWELQLSWSWTILRRLLVFLLIEYIWRTNGSDQWPFIIDAFTISSNNPVATWPVIQKKHATLLFERTTIVVFGSFWKTQRVDCFIVSGP